MSAIAIADPQVTRPDRGSVRPQLVLLPTGAEAVCAARASRPVMRLTGFGRLLVGLLVAVVLAMGAVAAAGSFASAAGPTVTMTVQSGDTLSQIAAQRLPDLSIPEGVVAIQLANGLSTSQVHAGQALVIPAG
ncbi:MAG: LysM peptidoglycan-binding domain-containing protein [Dermatophilaceae bacterium]